jgi:hypothetical protein
VPDQNIVNQAYSIAKGRGVSDQVMLSLFEAGVVESQFQNLNYGLDDSTGYLQQRVSQGWADPMNVTTATNSYLDQAIAFAAANPSATAGQIAQGVQRSGVPLAYDQNEAEALQLLQGVDPNASPTLAGASGGDTLLPGAPGGDDDSGIKAAIAAILGKIGAAADEFKTKAKIVEQIATAGTHLLLPSNLLRAASGALGVVLLCFALYCLGGSVNPS